MFTVKFKTDCVCFLEYMYTIYSEFLACFHMNFLSLSPVMTASSPEFFLQKALADSISSFLRLM